MLFFQRAMDPNDSDLTIHDRGQIVPSVPGSFLDRRRKVNGPPRISRVYRPLQESIAANDRPGDSRDRCSPR